MHGAEKRGKKKYPNEGRFHWLDRDPSQPRLKTADKHRLSGLKAGVTKICWKVCSSVMSHLHLNGKAPKNDFGLLFIFFFKKRVDSPHSTHRHTKMNNRRSTSAQNNHLHQYIRV